MSNQNFIIRPEVAAAKLAALKNLQAPKFREAIAKKPRLIELLWFIQAQSLQAGGIDKLAEDFLSTFADSIGTAAMHRIGKTDQPYTASERQEVIASFPQYGYEDQDTEYALTEFREQMLGETDILQGRHRQPNAAFVNKQNHAYFFGFCKRAAADFLPSLFHEFCTNPDAVIPDVWWFNDLLGTLLEMLDAHAGRESQGIVMTAVAREVHDALEFAWTEKAMVEIIGDSRFGKTEAVKAWCAMYPGRARLVKTPCDNCDRSLLEAIAEAAGIELTLKLTLRELKAKVEFVLKHSGLMFVFDEAAWLIPQRYGPRTTPMRLNYIRSQVLENGCPVALIQTPQFFGPAAKNFERTTGFNMAQWQGRIMRRVQLPAELPENDLAAVVLHHFPELDAPCVKRVIGCALVSESYLFAVLKIAKNARAVARKNGREHIQLDDLEAGISLVGIIIPQSAPALPAATVPAGRKTENPVAVRRGGRRATTPIVAMEAPAREVAPTLQPA
ncbi:MAG TPA: hypothetical protein VH595_03995 [Verrucomicrobiae bacterium]|jgi:hypothetical protein|nr:hypothetical protein [Verrucomicrobiae bacterium]